MPRQTAAEWKAGWVPKVRVTQLLISSTAFEKIKEWGVQPSEMLLICSDSEPFYPHNYPRLSEVRNCRDLEHQKKMVD